MSVAEKTAQKTEEIWESIYAWIPSQIQMFLGKKLFKPYYFRESFRNIDNTINNRISFLWSLIIGVLTNFWPTPLSLCLQHWVHAWQLPQKKLKWYFFHSLFISNRQKPLRQSLAEPEHVITDYAKFDRPGQLHIGWQALHKFEKDRGTLPRPRNKVGAFSLTFLCILLVGKQFATGSDSW